MTRADWAESVANKIIEIARDEAYGAACQATGDDEPASDLRRLRQELVALLSEVPE